VYDEWFVLHSVAKAILRKLHLYGLYSLKLKGPVHDDGWLRSFEEHRSVDLEGKPLPFIVYPAIEFLRRRIRPDMEVFEYGSGASTLWWAARVKRVVSCEHDPGWYRKISAGAPANATLLLQELDDRESYPRRILEFHEAFDVVVIDGRERVHCAHHCLGALKPGGVILWDNSDREKYESGYRFLQEHGFRRLEFVGLGPIVNEKSETSIFYRPNNCFGI
jgi:precorrin-6B methylase 2